MKRVCYLNCNTYRAYILHATNGQELWSEKYDSLHQQLLYYEERAGWGTTARERCDWGKKGTGGSCKEIEPSFLGSSRTETSKHCPNLPLSPLYNTITFSLHSSSLQICLWIPPPFYFHSYSMKPFTLHLAGQLFFQHVCTTSARPDHSAEITSAYTTLMPPQSYLCPPNLLYLRPKVQTNPGNEHTWFAGSYEVRCITELRRANACIRRAA